LYSASDSGYLHGESTGESLGVLLFGWQMLMIDMIVLTLPGIHELLGNRFSFGIEISESALSDSPCESSGVLMREGELVRRFFVLYTIESTINTKAHEKLFL
jgi:hypothetical protein